MHTWSLCPLLVFTLYLGSGTVPEFLRGYLKKGVFTLVLSKYHTRHRAPGLSVNAAL